MRKCELVYCQKHCNPARGRVLNGVAPHIGIEVEDGCDADVAVQDVVFMNTSRRVRERKQSHGATRDRVLLSDASTRPKQRDPQKSRAGNARNNVVPYIRLLDPQQRIFLGQPTWGTNSPEAFNAQLMSLVAN